MRNVAGELVATHLQAKIQLMAATCLKRSGRIKGVKPIDLGGGVSSVYPMGRNPYHDKNTDYWLDRRRNNKFVAVKLL